MGIVELTLKVMSGIAADAFNRVQRPGLYLYSLLATRSPCCHPPQASLPRRP
jgi:hypothetical protein